MKIYEYQAMLLFKEYGINTAACQLAENPDAAYEIAQRLGPKVVVKAQVLLGGRGKAGGIKVVNSAKEAKTVTEEILSMRIKSIPVECALIAKAVDIRKEYYLGVTIDRSLGKVVCMVSASGGVEIEEVAIKTPEQIFTLCVDPLKGLLEPELADLIAKVFNEDKLIRQAADTLNKIYKLFMEKDCSLVEINPYVQTASGDLVALDAKINFDDNALFKHPEIEKLRNFQEYSQEEQSAQRCGLSFVSMDGDVGCIVNGAGLAMATMDIIKLFGRDAANFLDVGGSSNPDKVLKALEIILSNSQVKSILINIFGGITRCDDIAAGIIKASEQIKINVPLVIRLIGTNDTQGRNMLKEKGFEVCQGMSEAIKQVTQDL